MKILLSKTSEAEAGCSGRVVIPNGKRLKQRFPTREEFLCSMGVTGRNECFQNRSMIHGIGRGEDRLEQENVFGKW